MSVSIANPAVAQLASLQSNSLPGSPLFGLINTSSAYMSWFDANPATLADNSVIGTMSITLAGNPPSASDVLLGSTPIAAKASQLIAGSINEFVPILQNGSVCLSANFGIAGRITREDNVGIGNVSVQITGSGVNQTTVTDNQGNYSFSNLNAGGNYTITPSKNINHKNGLSGFDLVSIQRHILNLAPLNSPFKVIAADANNSKSITGLDLALFQRLILGLDQTLTANTSWQFVDKFHVFSNPNVPWTPAYPQTRTISGLSANITNADFTGIKIGDVNLSNDPTGANSQWNEDRGLKSFTLQVPDRVKVSNGLVNIPILAGEDLDLQGIQFTLEFNREIFQLVNLNPGESLDRFGESNTNLNRAKEGVAALVWVSPDGYGQKLMAGHKLFEVVMSVKGNSPEWIELADKIHLSDEITKSAAVGNNMTEYDLKWEISSSVAGNRNTFQFAPNPFNRTTTLFMNLNKATNVSLRLLDTDGRILFEESKWLEKGRQLWSLPERNLSEGKVIYYHIQTDSEMFSGRLLKLD